MLGSKEEVFEALNGVRRSDLRKLIGAFVKEGENACMINMHCSCLQNSLAGLFEAEEVKVLSFVNFFEDANIELDGLLLTTTGILWDEVESIIDNVCAAAFYL